MKPSILVLVLSYGLTYAQTEDLPIAGEVIRLPCCTKDQTTHAIDNLRDWIFDHLSCDPLIACLFKCLKVSIVPTQCSINYAFHVIFNKWLLDNYQCLPSSLLQCVKGCIVYNPRPPCPIICTADTADPTINITP